MPLDPDYPVERLAYMQSDAGLETVLTQVSLSGRLPFEETQAVYLDSDA